jgi:hypothetical protein
MIGYHEFGKMWKEEIMFRHLHGRAGENYSLRTVVVPEEI